MGSVVQAVSRLRVMEVCVGLMAYWLCVPAQTPGILRPQCCSTEQWPAAVANLDQLRPEPPGSEAQGGGASHRLLSRIPGTRHWTIAPFGGGGPHPTGPLLQFTLPQSVEAVVEDIAPPQGIPLILGPPGGVIPPPADFAGPYFSYPSVGGSGPPGGGGGGVSGGAGSQPPIVSPVPEPRTWGLLILGVGMMGAILRVLRPFEARRRPAGEA